LNLFNSTLDGNGFNPTIINTGYFSLSDASFLRNKITLTNDGALDFIASNVVSILDDVVINNNNWMYVRCDVNLERFETIVYNNAAISFEGNHFINGLDAEIVNQSNGSLFFQGQTNFSCYLQNPGEIQVTGIGSILNTSSLVYDITGTVVVHPGTILTGDPIRHSGNSFTNDGTIPSQSLELYNVGMNFYGNGTIENLIINTNDGVGFFGNQTVTISLEFLVGKIITNGSAVFSIGEDAVVIGASANSYVIGSQLQKQI
jgi:hypothetical protein